MAGYGCKGSEFYPNVTSQRTAKSSLSQVMTPLGLNFLWKKLEKHKDTRHPVQISPAVAPQPEKLRWNVCNLLTLPVTSKSQRGESKLFHYTGKTSLMPKFQFHFSLDQTKACCKGVMPHLLCFTDIWQRKSHGPLKDVRDIEFFTCLGCFLFFYYSQHFIAGSSLPPKVWFNSSFYLSSSYHLSLILKWSATCLTEIKVVSTYISSVFNACESLTMRCRAAIKK